MAPLGAPCARALNFGSRAPLVSPPAPRAAAEAAAAQQQEQGDGEGGSAEGAESKARELPPSGLPISVVKKIALKDPDISRISAEGARALTIATSLFIELLAGKALEHAQSQKRKGIKFEDLQHVVARDRCAAPRGVRPRNASAGDVHARRLCLPRRTMVEMGLPDLLASDAAFADVHAKAAENDAKHANKRKATELEQQPKGVRAITAFFSAPAATSKPAAAQHDAAAADAGPAE